MDEERQEDQLEPTYNSFFADTRCSLEDLLGVMDDKKVGGRGSGRSGLVA